MAVNRIRTAQQKRRYSFREHLPFCYLKTAVFLHHILVWINQPIADADETVGVFEDVDAAGNLILVTAKGRVAITAADVYF